MIFWWGDLASTEEVRAWFATQLTTAANAAWVLSLMMNRSTSGDKTRYYIRPSFVEQYVDIDAIEKLLTDFDANELPEKEKIAVREFRRALRRRREGKPEFDMMRRFEIDDADDE